MALDTDTPEGGKTCLREDNNREDDDFSFTDSGDEDSGDEDSGDEDSGYSKSLFLDLFIPKFKRVKDLSVDQAGVLNCSCGFAQRNFMPCRHQLHVLQVCEGRSPTIADIHMRWYKGYQQCAYGSEHSTGNCGPTFEDCTTEDLLERNEYTGASVGRTIMKRRALELLINFRHSLERQQKRGF